MNFRVFFVKNTYYIFESLNSNVFYWRFDPLQSKIEGNIEIKGCSTTLLDIIKNESCLTIWISPKSVFESNPSPRIEGIRENESCSTTWVNPEIVFEPYTDPKSSPSGPKR